MCVQHPRKSYAELAIGFLSQHYQFKLSQLKESCCKLQDRISQHWQHFVISFLLHPQLLTPFQSVQGYAFVKYLIIY